MSKRIEFAINIIEFDKDALGQLKAARDEVAKIEKQITDAYLKSDRFKAACDLAGISDYGTKHSPVTGIDKGRIVTAIYADIADEAASSTARPTLYLGEKTINMLLSGKLLDDAQKKALLKQIGFDVASLPAEPSAQAEIPPFTPRKGII